MPDDRDTHFKNFAKLLWDELVRANGYGYIDVNEYDDDGIDPTDYLTLIARRAYDLVYQALYYNDAGYWPGLPQQAPDHYKRQIIKATNDIPDLTEWPPIE